MKQIKPYLFWIVCGAILIVEIAVVTLVRPTSKHGKAPEVVKQQFEAELRKIENDWLPRAEATLKIQEGATTEMIYPEDPKSVKQTAQKYILRKEWKDFIKAKRKEYENDAAALRKWVISTSEPLHESLANTDVLADWYAAYREATAELMMELVGAGVLEPPANLAERLENAEVKHGPYATDSGYRKRLGFNTRGVEFPDKNVWKPWTDHFRIVQYLTRRLAQSRGEIATNPRVEAVGGIPPDPLTGEEREDNLKLARQLDELGLVTIIDLEVSDKYLGGMPNNRPIKLTLRGTPGALIEACRSIDRVDDNDEPIFIRRSSNWKRITDASPAHKDRADLPMELSLDLVVCDFTGIK